MRCSSLILLSFLLCAATLASAQRTYWAHLQRNLPTYSLSFASGYADGVADVLRDKYSVSVFPQSGPARYYFDPRISWQRKYRAWPEDPRPAYPGATTWLAFTTDAWHLAKTAHLKTMQLGTILYRPPYAPTIRQLSRSRWWWPLADLSIASITFSAGWHAARLTLTR